MASQAWPVRSAQRKACLVQEVWRGKSYSLQADTKATQEKETIKTKSSSSQLSIERTSVNFKSESLMK